MPANLGAKASRSGAHACVHDGIASGASELGEAVEIALFRGVRGPGREIFALDRGGKFRRRAEEPARLARGKSGKPRRLEIGRRAIASFDHVEKLGGERG